MLRLEFPVRYFLSVAVLNGSPTFPANIIDDNKNAIPDCILESRISTSRKSKTPTDWLSWLCIELLWGRSWDQNSSGTNTQGLQTKLLRNKQVILEKLIFDRENISIKMIYICILR